MSDFRYSYHSNGNIRKISLYTNDERNGIEKHYYSHGALSIVVNYKNNLLHGKRWFLNAFGRVGNLYNYRMGKKHGICKEYSYVPGSTSLAIMTSYSFLNGICHGPAFTKFPQLPWENYTRYHMHGEVVTEEEWKKYKLITQLANINEKS